MSQAACYPLIGIPASSLTLPDVPAYCCNAYCTAALAAAGAAIVVIPLDLPEPALYAVLDRLDGVCLTGGYEMVPVLHGDPAQAAAGPTDPARDATELIAVRWALAADVPILGICRGAQMLNVAAGGRLYEDLPSERPGPVYHHYRPVVEIPWDRLTHRVQLRENSRLAGMLGAGELWTNSFHYQAADLIGDGLKAVAWADDGVVEAIEAPHLRFAVGVQWHPENLTQVDARARRLFEAFVAAASAASGNT